MPALDLTPVLGSNYYTILEDTAGNGHIVWNLAFIVTAIFFLITWKYVMSWITLLIRAGFKVGDR